VLIKQAIDLEKAKGAVKGAIEILKKLAGSPNPKVAATAREELARLQQPSSRSTLAQPDRFPSELVSRTPAGDGLSLRRVLPNGDQIAIRQSGSDQRRQVSLVLVSGRSGSERELTRLSALPRGFDLEPSPDGAHVGVIVGTRGPSAPPLPVRVSVDRKPLGLRRADGRDRLLRTEVAQLDAIDAKLAKLPDERRRIGRLVTRKVLRRRATGHVQMRPRACAALEFVAKLDELLFAAKPAGVANPRHAMRDRGCKDAIELRPADPRGDVEVRVDQPGNQESVRRIDPGGPVRDPNRPRRSGLLNPAVARQDRRIAKRRRSGAINDCGPEIDRTEPGWAAESGPGSHRRTAVRAASAGRMLLREASSMRRSAAILLSDCCRRPVPGLWMSVGNRPVPQRADPVEKRPVPSPDETCGKQARPRLRSAVQLTKGVFP
jgi:hypothetical protein